MRCGTVLAYLSGTVLLGACDRVPSGPEGWPTPSASTSPLLQGNISAYSLADSFDRPDNETVGNGWSEYEPGGSARIDGGALRLTTGSQTGDGVKVFRPLSSHTNLKITGTVRFATAFSRMWLLVRADGASSLRKGYGFSWRFTGQFDNHLILFDNPTDELDIGGFQSVDVQQGLSLGQAISFEMLVFGDNALQVRVWAQSGERPPTPTLSSGPRTPLANGSDLAIVESTRDATNGDFTIDDLAVSEVPAFTAAGPIVNPSNGHTYYLLEPAGWTNSEDQAVALGGHLVTINDADEQQWVFGQFATYGGITQQLWIGLRSTTTATPASAFTWVSGDPATYRNWAPPEPNDPPEVAGLSLYVRLYGPDHDQYPGRWDNWPDNYSLAGCPTCSNPSGVVEVSGPAPPPPDPPRAVACVVEYPFDIPREVLACAHTVTLAGFLTPYFVDETTVFTAMPEEIQNKLPPRVLLVGGLSSGDQLTYQWVEITPTGSSVDLCPSGEPCPANLPVFLTPGQHILSLTVRDANGLSSDPERVMVTVPELVILVHGILGGTGPTFGDLPRILGNDYRVLSFDYSKLSSCQGVRPGISVLSLRFQLFIDQIRSLAPQYRSMNVFTHSMGGLVVRAFMAGVISDPLTFVDPPPRPYTAGLFKTLILAGTPNYGSQSADLTRLMGCSLQQQEEDMLLGSHFVATLDRAWVHTPAVASTGVLTVAGIMQREPSRSRFPHAVDAEGDGAVLVASATLPAAILTTVSYSKCGHNDVVPLSECGIVHYVEGGDDGIVRAARAFLAGKQLPADLLQPREQLDFGLSLIFLVDKNGNQVTEVTGKPVLVLRDLKATGRPDWSLKCDGMVIEPMQLHCPALGSDGAMSIVPMPASDFVLRELKGMLWRGSVPYDICTDLPKLPRFTVTAGRPSVITVPVGPEGRCGN